MKTKNFPKKIWLLACLLVLSFAFYVAAQENSSTQNIFLDSDQDGLTDEEEKIYGTDPKNRDTDNDSYSDGAEIKAGYNPKIPAPGDRLIDFQNQPADKTDVPPAGGNLTEQISQKIADLPADSEISIDNIQAIIDESLSTQDIETEIPEVSIDDIKIKKSNYSKYSDEEAKKRKKEDFSDYIASVFYIFTSNSPVPITSETDIGLVISQILQKVVAAVSTQNPDSLEDISESGERMFEQLNDVEVPEDLVDFHVKALRYALYAQSLKSLLKSNPQDPLSDIANLSKIQTFIESIMSFSMEFENALSESDLNYSDIQGKLKDYGIDLPDEEILSKSLEIDAD